MQQQITYKPIRKHILMKNNRLITLTLSLLFILVGTKSTQGQEYAIGADLSFIKQAEDSGFVFKDMDGKAKKGLDIFKNHGYNWIRLRLFHTPSELPNNRNQGEIMSSLKQNPYAISITG